MNAKTKEPKRGRCIALGNFKGGVWKTTIAIHLAAHLKAAIIDLDVKQEDSHRFALHYGLESYLTNNEEEVFDIVERLVSSGQDVVIDCPPHEGPETQMAVMIADAVVVPSGPGPHDLYGLGRTMSLVRTVRMDRPGLPMFLVCTEYRRTRAADAFVASLQSSTEGQYIGKLWRRVEVADAVEEFRPTWEYRPGSPGAEEMKNLCTFLDRKVVPYEQ